MMRTSRVQLQDEFVKSRRVPIEHTQIAGTDTGTADTIYTVRTGVSLVLQHLSAVNITGTAATLSLHAVPSGGSIGNSNYELAAVSIPANTAVNLTDFVGQYYAAGTTLEAYSGTTNALVIHGWAEELL